MTEYTFVLSDGSGSEIPTAKHDTRETWLKEAMGLMLPWFKRQNAGRNGCFKNRWLCWYEQCLCAN